MIDHSSYFYGVALDVGIKNMSICALKLPEINESQQKSISTAKTRLQNSELICWESVQLDISKEHSAFVSEAKAVSEFVRSRTYIFEMASYVIVEHQMAAKMRGIAAALFACISLLFPTVLLHFQLSKTKLSWEDLPEILPDVNFDTYSARKRASIQIVEWLLEIPRTNRRQKQASLAAIDTSNMKQLFAASKKKDDLADSLLHLLAFSRLPKKKRKSSKSPDSIGIDNSAQ